jgi:DnaB-like helicase N terminal domain/AAA domain
VKTRVTTPRLSGAKPRHNNGEPDIQKTPPHSKEAEMGVLSSMMLSPRQAIAECIAAGLESNWFYVPANRTIYEELRDVWDSGGAIDLITFTQRLRDKGLLESVGGAAAVTDVQLYLDKIFNFAPTAANLPYHIAIVRDLYVRRQIIENCTESVRRAYDPNPNADMCTVLDEIASKAESLRSMHGKDGAAPGKSFIELAKLPLAHFEKDNLVGNRFLCREGFLEIAAPTHSGKSSASTQMKLCWAAGRAAFDIKPKCPLRIVDFQAENDEGDLADMARGMLKHSNFTKAEQRLILENYFRYDLRGISGEKFLAIARKKVREHKADLLWFDALQNYLGGNVRDPTIVIPFLDGLDRILVEFRIGAVATHHTPKTIGRDTSEWTATDWIYYGAGVAALADRKRASIAIEPTRARGIFKFHATKRGDRIGWADENGHPIFERFFCWNSSKEEMFWRDATDEDLLRIQSAERKSKGGKTEDDLFNLVPPTKPIPQNELLARGQKIDIGTNTGRGMLKILVADGRLHEWSIKRPRVRPEIWIARFPQPEPELPV